jgi:membrane-associated PAP2 superfamily phosphatase
VTRNWLLAFVAVGVLVGIAFAAFPSWDLQIAELFFDPSKAKFPLSVDYSLNIIRRIFNWFPYLLLAPAAFVLLRKLIFPASPMLMAPSVVLFLVGSFLARTGAHQQPPPQGELGQAAAELRAAICRQRDLPALVAPKQRLQAELLFRVG